MGVTVRQKQAGRGEAWWVFVHHDGVRKSKQVGDKRTAEALAAEIRKRLKAGELGMSSGEAGAKVPTFGKYADHFVENYAKMACKRTTWVGYEAIIRNILKPAWERRRLDQITRSDVKQLLLRERVNKKGKARAANSINNIRNLISGIFTHACDDEIINTNPAQRMGKYIPKLDRKRHIRPLTREQVRTFLAAMKEHAKEHHAFFMCACRTGMRLGELTGLAWEDVDFEANTITVRRSFTRGYWTSPKSHRERVVDLSDQLKQTLIDHRAELLKTHGGKLPATEATLPGHDPQKLHLVFPNRAGGPEDGANLRKRVLHQVLEKANLPHMRVHDTRHTFASLLLQDGAPLPYVKEQMGHASIQITVDVYGHLVPGANRHAVNRLDDPAEPHLRLVQAG